MRGIREVRYTDTFERDYRRLSVDIQNLVDGCLKDLWKDPVPKSRRLHSVSPKGRRPIILTVDLTPGKKSYKISFHVEAGLLWLRRVATHGEIDRAP